MNEIKRGAGGGDGSTAEEMTGEPRAGGGASPGYRLRRCDEEEHCGGVTAKCPVQKPTEKLLHFNS